MQSIFSEQSRTAAFEQSRTAACLDLESLGRCLNVFHDKNYGSVVPSAEMI